MPGSARSCTVLAMGNDEIRVEVTVIAVRSLDGGPPGEDMRRLAVTVDHPERSTYQLVIVAAVPPSAAGRVFTGARLPARAGTAHPDDVTIAWSEIG